MTAGAVSFLLLFALRTEISALVWMSFPRARTYVSLMAALLLSTTVALIPPADGLLTIALWSLALIAVMTAFRHELRGLASNIRPATAVQ